MVDEFEVKCELFNEVRRLARKCGFGIDLEIQTSFDKAVRRDPGFPAIMALDNARSRLRNGLSIFLYGKNKPLAKMVCLLEVDIEFIRDYNLLKEKAASFAALAENRQADLARLADAFADAWGSYFELIAKQAKHQNGRQAVENSTSHDSGNTRAA